MDVIGQNGNTGEHYEEEEKEKEEDGLPKGYMQKTPTNNPISFPQEIAELSRIIGKDLTQKQIEELKASKLTKAFNDDDDLIIRY